MMEEYKQIISVDAAAETETRRSGMGFKRTAALVCMAAILGGGTLGAGLGAGYMLANHFLPEPVVEEEILPAFSFENAQTPVVPINVQVNNFSGIVKSVADSVVSINVVARVSMYGFPLDMDGAGSGIIFAEDENKIYVATNNHVVDGVSTVSISLDDEESVSAKIIGRDSQSDLAVLSVLKADLDASNIEYRIATFGDSSQLEVGDQVVAIGNSMGEGKIATSGIVSAINKQITVDQITLDVIQTDAAINMGNSGGALVNTQGEVIGINTAKLYASGVEGMGYSIPIKEAQVILESLKMDGSIKKPYLGIQYPRTIDEQMKDWYSLPSVGVLVSAVAENSGAERAGLEANDIIVSFNGEAITSAEDLVNALTLSKVGDEVKIEVYRGSLLMTFNVVIGNANE